MFRTSQIRHNLKLKGISKNIIGMHNQFMVSAITGFYYLRTMILN